VGGTTLRAFFLSALWQIYETLYLLLRVQECRFITPSQGAGLIVLSMGDGILTHPSFGFPDPTVGSWITLEVKKEEGILATLFCMIVATLSPTGYIRHLTSMLPIRGLNFSV
jgi:hypothetical protein